MNSCINFCLGGLIILFLTGSILAINNNNRWNSVFTRASYWIKTINGNNACTWQAGQNFHPYLHPKYIKSLVGTLGFPEKAVKFANNIRTEFIKELNVPSSFDARLKWRKCKSLNLIRDQGECGSCWAVAASNVLGDRICIASKGKVNIIVSAEEPLTCCTKCGAGCDGGYVDEVWRFFESTGVVSGGEYNSKEGCQPYSKEPCEHYNKVNSTLKMCGVLQPMLTPLCNITCTNDRYDIAFIDDHRKVKKAYILPPNEKVIQMELLNNGPLQAVYEVYEDFLSYKSGVYKRTVADDNTFIGLHSVKLIGWDTEKSTNTPYWLVMNSWNSNWGDNGMFKIIRGINNCNFEIGLIGGVPYIN